MDESSIPLTKEERRRAALRRYYLKHRNCPTFRQKAKENHRKQYLAHREELIAGAMERQKDRIKRNPALVAAKMRRYRAQNPEKDAARNAVQRAIKRGHLIRPTSCQYCGKIARLHGHHHNGYTGKHKLDVVWLCQPCHKTEHRKSW